VNQLVIKAVISGIVIAVASEAARRSSVLGAIIISLPLTSILALAWLYRDTGNAQKVQDLSWSILWVIVPSLAFFVVLPLLIRGGVGVPLAIVGACAVTAVVYAVYVLGARRLGFNL
jgi:uncharacterized membrane protein (GlpM family)